MLLQVPGAVELVVLLLVAILVFGIPLLLIAVVGALYLRAAGDSDEDVDERIAELEAEIASLRAELEERSVEDGDND